MDFFQQQAKVRGRSRGLVLLFLLAVAGIVGAIDLVVALAVNILHSPRTPMPPLNQTLVLSSLAVLAVIALSTLYRISSLSGGGASVAQDLGAVLVPPDTRDPAYHRLRNVVEEIAIAAGLPVPQIFVLEDEAGINAFAAGFSPADAAVTVTRGALDKLDRNELQGVIAHEFSHILNGDMRLNIRLMGLLFGILVLGIIGGKVMQFGPRGDDRKGGAAIFVIALGLFVIGYVGVFFGRLIKASVSRQREYLADASAVQFTRQSLGIAGALKKLAGVSAGSRLTNAHGEEVAHMLFGDGMGYSALFATHPPLFKRIRVLEPAFNPALLAALGQQWNDPGYVPQDEDEAGDFGGAPTGYTPVGAGAATPPKTNVAAAIKAGAIATAAVGAAATPIAAAGATLSLAPGSISASVGQPQAAHYDCAAALHQALPEVLLAAARDPEQAVDLVLARLLDPQDGAARSSQTQAIAATLGAARGEAAAALIPVLAQLHPAQRLPLAAIAMPSLRRQSREALIKLAGTVDTLIHAAGSMSVFQYCLGRVLSQNLVDSLRPAQAGAAGRGRLEGNEEQIRCLLSVVAAFGQEDADAARRAFLSGMQQLPLRQALTYQAPDLIHWSASFNLALRALDVLEPPAKALLLEAVGATIAADGKVTVEEAELLRTICAALHCPLPPVLADVA